MAMTLFRRTIPGRPDATGNATATPTRGTAMKYSNRVCTIAFAGVLAGLAGWQPALAQGVGNATMSVGITIVAPDLVAARDAADDTARTRIPVDPAYAVDPAEPLRGARVEQVALADGDTLQVVSY